MLLAVRLADAKFLCCTLLATQVLLLDLIFGSHGLFAVLQPAKVCFIALVALVESYIVHGEALKVIVVGCTLSDNSVVTVKALFNCFFNG